MAETLVDGFSPVGSYRLETYLGKLTFPGEPRRTAVTASESQRFPKADSLYSFLRIVSIIRIVSVDVEGILRCSSVEEDMTYCSVLVCY